MTVVDLKVPKRAKRGLPLEQSSGAARFFGRMFREIENDLGGHRTLSRIQRELLQAFCGAATQIQYLNHQVLIGEASELDFTTYAQLASTMVRLASRLGIERKQLDVTPSLHDIAAEIEASKQVEEVDDVT
jgi:hypothetical protein